MENATNGGNPKILEPIHILLSNTLKAMFAIRIESIPSVTKDSCAQFKANMKSFVLRLSRASLEDFELSNTSSDMATHIGLRNTQYATLLVGAYEVNSKITLQMCTYKFFILLSKDGDGI